MTEDRVAELFEQVVERLHPDVGPLVDAGEARGKTLRTRRRIRIVAGNALALAAVAGAATALIGPGSAANVQAAQSSATSKSSTTPTKPSSADKGMTSARMLSTLKELMPAGAKITTSKLTEESKNELEVYYDDGHGLSDIIMYIDTGDTVGDCPAHLWADEGPRPAGALPKSCVTRTLPGGVTERDAVENADLYGFYGYQIYVGYPDGVTVSIQVGNGTLSMLNPRPDITRAVPPGTMQQWAAIVESPLWHS